MSHIYPDRPEHISKIVKNNNKDILQPAQSHFSTQFFRLILTFSLSVYAHKNTHYMFNDKFFLVFFEDSPEFFEDSPDISMVFAEGSGFCRLPEIHVMSIHFPPPGKRHSMPLYLPTVVKSGFFYTFANCSGENRPERRRTGNGPGIWDRSPSFD